MSIVELRELVFEFLSNDKQSLCSCSLTCHTWAYSAQSFLFRELKICPLGHGETAFLDFRDFLKSRPPFSAIRRHTRYLTLSGVWGYSLDSYVTVTVRRSVIATIIQSLPYLESLCLEHSTIVANFISRNIPRRTLQSLTLRDLKAPRTHSWQDICGIFDLFTSVSALSIQITDTEDYPPMTTSYRFPKDICIKEMALISFESHPGILRALSNSGAIHTLNSLRTSCGRAEDFVALSELLHRVCGRLTAL